MVVRFIGLFTGNPQLYASYGALIFFKAGLLVNPALIARADENSALSFFCRRFALVGRRWSRFGGSYNSAYASATQPATQQNFLSFGMLAQSVVLDECETHARYALSVLNSENDFF